LNRWTDRDMSAALGCCVGSVCHATDASPQKLENLRLGSRLHDIVRSTVPQGLPGIDKPLAGEESALVRSYQQTGAELLEATTMLRGTVIPLDARILDIADTFDALVAPPWNGRRRNAESALNLLRLQAGTQLDPGMAETFLRLDHDLPPMDGDLLEETSHDTTRWFGAVCAAAPMGGGRSVPPVPPPSHWHDERR
jgi:response regulator RpfG family c-di-GMP phosphodiesterase